MSNWNYAVGIETCYGLDSRAVAVRLPAEARNLPLLRSFLIDPVTHWY